MKHPQTRAHPAGPPRSDQYMYHCMRPSAARPSASHAQYPSHEEVQQTGIYIQLSKKERRLLSGRAELHINVRLAHLLVPLSNIYADPGWMGRRKRFSGVEKHTSRPIGDSRKLKEKASGVSSSASAQPHSASASVQQSYEGRRRHRGSETFRNPTGKATQDDGTCRGKYRHWSPV